MERQIQCQPVVLGDQRREWSRNWELQGPERREAEVGGRTSGLASTQLRLLADVPLLLATVLVPLRTEPQSRWGHKALGRPRVKEPSQDTFSSLQGHRQALRTCRVHLALQGLLGHQALSAAPDRISNATSQSTCKVSAWPPHTLERRLREMEKECWGGRHLCEGFLPPMKPGLQSELTNMPVHTYASSSSYLEVICT